jgi:putative tryptophan/tyrosine transport system substrate-binding protein
MRRREFIAGISAAAAAARPLVARARQDERGRRLGILMGWDESDPQAKASLSAFAEGLGELGWAEGRNLRLDIRWTSGNADRRQMFAKELVESQPDLILSNTTPVTAALRATIRFSIDPIIACTA